MKKRNNKGNIWISNLYDNKGREVGFFGDEDCFEEIMLKSLNSEYCKSFKSFIYLKKVSDKWGGHTQDLLDKIFIRDVYIDLDTARSLNKHDVVTLDGGLLRADTYIGKCVLEVVGTCGYEIILDVKRYMDVDDIELNFLIYHPDNYSEFLHHLNNRYK